MPFIIINLETSACHVERACARARAALLCCAERREVQSGVRSAGRKRAAGDVTVRGYSDK